MINAGNLSKDLLRILKNNAPVRDGSKYPGVRGASQYPGYLKNAGIYEANSSNTVAVVLVGGDNVPYAVFTETRSRKKGWHKKSANDFLTHIQGRYNAKITR